MFQKIEDKVKELLIKPVWNTQPNHGELVEPLQEFQEFQDQVPTDQVKPLSVTCVEKVECSLH